MSSGFDVLIDTDIFVALFMPADLLANEAKQTYQQLKTKGVMFVTTNLVVGETATILSIRAGHNTAKLFLDRVKDIDIVFVDQKLYTETIEFFKQQNSSRGVSMVDCSNVVMARRLNLDQIFSFDKFYKEHGASMIANTTKDTSQ